MPEYSCEVFIKLKDVISDPPGDAVKNCLSQHLGFEGVQRLRMGRELSFVLSANNLRAARETVEKIAKLPQIGASPVMETYEFSVKRIRSRRVLTSE